MYCGGVSAAEFIVHLNERGRYAFVSGCKYVSTSIPMRDYVLVQVHKKDIIIIYHRSELSS